jgi:hypothetical protein
MAPKSIMQKPINYQKRMELLLVLREASKIKDPEERLAYYSGAAFARLLQKEVSAHTNTEDDMVTADEALSSVYGLLEEGGLTLQQANAVKEVLGNMARVKISEIEQDILARNSKSRRRNSR